jgi:hypothetical protein
MEEKKKNKAGPWSKDEKTFIQQQAGRLDPEEIAEKLSRNKDAVKDYMLKSGLMKYYSQKQMEHKDTLLDIEDSSHWPTLVQQFSFEELSQFKYHWANIVRQFRDDILHTEELQIIDVIKLQILMDRLLTNTARIERQIKEIDTELAILYKDRTANINKIEELQLNQTRLSSVSESHAKEYNNYLKEKNLLFSKLKATREQRIKEIESSKSTLTGWIKQVLTDPQLRIDLGLEMEKRRIATKEEYKRLSEFHTYQDGTVDIPILNHETVIRNEEVQE